MVTRKRPLAGPTDYNDWTWPEGLHPLRDQLAARGVDVGSLKSARQALYVAKTLFEIPGVIPKRGEEFMALMAVQKRVTGVRHVKAKAQVAIVTNNFGTFGPASSVRSINPSTFNLDDLFKDQGGDDVDPIYRRLKALR